jgi:hypothetical protein
MFSSLKSSLPKVVAVVGLLILGSLMGEVSEVRADRWAGSGGRYYYGNRGSHFYYGSYWGQGRNYYTYYYYYRPNAYATEYNYHTCFYYPQTYNSIPGNYYYYKNNVSGNYWGRCHPESSDYELLPVAAQGPVLANIPQKDFQPQGKMTPVPNMEPAAPIIPPPMPQAPPAE